MINSKQPPLVSVVLPVYNALPYLKESVESILSQTYQNFELLLIDDCSTDGSNELLRKYVLEDTRVKLIVNNENLRIVKSLNKGIHASQGKYIMRMDADDISISTRMELQVDFMESNPEVGVCGGSMELVDSSLVHIGIRRYYLDDKAIRKHIFKFSPFSHPATMFRKSTLEQSDLYDPKCLHGEDYDLYFRIGKVAKFGNLQEIILKYRVHKNSLTNKNLRELELETIKTRRKYFDAYGATTGDRVYSLLQLISIYIMPSSLKARVFIFFRGMVR
jgi:glycosyltransferase involved in cell wall biosynthesis